MSEIPPRPKVAPPVFANIPLELRQRKQWVCWAMEWRSDKWTKVPYTPGTLQKARSNAPNTWSTFEAAKAAYLERADYFAGIGYVFAKDDPYVGGDRDHNLSTEGIPPTYAEISPSGNGIKFIARASGAYGRKTNTGELYSSGRFFTITGNVLSGFERITECQAAVDAFLASLGGDAQAKRSSVDLNGTRAELVKRIPEEEWKAGARLHKHELNRCLARVRSAAVSGKTHKDDTQLGLLLREDYEAFDKKYPYAGIFRGDGTLDRSKVRAVVASNIRSRGFEFPVYVAVFFHLFGAECVAKWGTTEGFKQEAAACWLRARSPRQEEYKPGQPAPAKPGLGSDHAELLERAYQALLDHKAGIEAIGTVENFAQVANVSERTMRTLLQELEDAGRISRRRLSRGGFVIAFCDRHNEKDDRHNGENDRGEIEHTKSVNEDTQRTAITAVDRGHSDRHNGAAQTCDLPAPEENKHADERVSDDREIDAPYIYIEHNSIQPVLYPAPVADHKIPTLRQLAEHYLSLPATAIGRRIVNERIGTVLYRRDVKHFAELVTAEYPYGYDAATEAYRTEQARRAQLAMQEWSRFFRRLKAMTNDELIAYITVRLRTEVAELAREGAAFDKHLYQTRMKVAKQHLEWRGLSLPAQQTRAKPHQPRPKEPPRPKPVIEQHSLLEQPSTTANGLIGRLKARKEHSE